MPKQLFPDQRSTTDQLRDLIRMANQNGLYDAADFLQRHCDAVDANAQVGQQPTGAKNR